MVTGHPTRDHPASLEPVCVLIKTSTTKELRDECDRGADDGARGPGRAGAGAAGGGPGGAVDRGRPALGLAAPRPERASSWGRLAVVLYNACKIEVGTGSRRS